MTCFQRRQINRRCSPFQFGVFFEYHRNYLAWEPLLCILGGGAGFVLVFGGNGTVVVGSREGRMPERHRAAFRNWDSHSTYHLPYQM